MQRFARVGNLGRCIGEDLAGVPQIGPAARRGRDENLVGSLVRTAALFGLKPPTQARLAFIEAEGILAVFATQVNRSASCRGHMGFGAEGTPPGNESGGGAESKAAGKMAARTRMVEISVT